MNDASVHTAVWSDARQADARARRDTGVLTLFFGVLLPAFVLLFEAMTHVCAAISFDPIPTVWHVALVALVPVANAVVLAALWSGNLAHTRSLGWLNGAAIGVALVYAINCSVLAPVMLVGMIVCGLGIVPLAPALSLVVAVVLRRRLRRRAVADSVPGVTRVWAPLLAAVAVLLALSAPTVVTKVATGMAASDPGNERALQLLRDYGDDDELLALCFGANRPLAPEVMLTALFGLSDLRPPPGLRKIPTAEARKLYYRVTGTPYSAVRPPKAHFVAGDRIRSQSDNNDWDFDQGRDAVAARVGGLSLKRSEYSGTVDAEAGVAYMEWVLVFRNESEVQREARARIALPPGGVVSRLTLWVNGEEREAAYSCVRKVTAAYKSVVQRRRDPVLARHAGRGRVLVQCFPVPPGGEMKTRIGVTAPLTLESHDIGMLRLPYFVERNFSIPDEAAHSLVLASKGRIATMLPRSGVRSRTAGNGSFVLEGMLTGTGATEPFTCRVLRRKKCAQMWTGEHHEGEGKIVRQRIVVPTLPAHASVVIVIDGSRRMAPHRERISQIVRQIPDGAECSVLVAGDSVRRLNEFGRIGRQARRRLAEAVEGTAFEGGCDNVPALARARELISSRPEGAVFWLHATQPVKLSDPASLVADWNRDASNVKLYSVQFDSGPSVAAKEMEKSVWFERIPGFGDPEDQVRRLVAVLRGGPQAPAFERECVDVPAAGRAGLETSSHVARLWAYERVLALVAAEDGHAREAALRLASAYRLVTPVSGAVVLETREQYSAAGLDPADSESVPHTGAVPEPETWALLAVGMAVMALANMKTLRRVPRRARASRGAA